MATITFVVFAVAFTLPGLITVYWAARPKMLPSSPPVRVPPYPS